MRAHDSGLRPCRSLETGGATVSTEPVKKIRAKRHPSGAPQAMFADRGALPVLDNVPDQVPVTIRELEVIETYLAQLIDQLLDETVSDVS